MDWYITHRVEWTDILGVDWRYDIEEYLASQGSIATVRATNHPLDIEWLTASDSLLEAPIKGSIATLSVECKTNFQYIGLYSSEQRVRRVKIYWGAGPTLYWQGWLNSDYKETYDGVPYTVTIVAADGLGMLKDIPFQDEGVDYTGREKESDIILAILDKIGYSQFTEYENVYEDRMNSDVDDSPMDQVQPDQDVFVDRNCYETLGALLRKMNAVIRQWDGDFCVYRPAELIGDTVYGRTITAEDITGTSMSPDQYMKRVGITDDSKIKDINGGVLMLQMPASKVTGKQNYGQNPSWIRNSTFQKEEGIINYWTAIGTPIWDQARNIEGFEGETEGVALSYAGSGTPLTTTYITQSFGAYAGATDDVMEFSVDIKFKNTHTDPISVNMYMMIRDDASGQYLSNYDEVEYRWLAYESYILISIADVPLGVSETWHQRKRIVNGLDAPGPYTVRLYGPNSAYITAVINNLIFRATSNVITGYEKTGRVEIDNVTNVFVPGIKITSIAELEEIVEREYIKDNEINGEEIEVAFELGDVGDTEIDNNLDQFRGSLLISAEDTLALCAKRFVAGHADDYASGSVVLTSSGADLIFTSATAGTDFTGTTSVTPGDGTLDGDVVATQANVTAVKRDDIVNVPDVATDYRITCDNVTIWMFWDTNRATTISTFVATYGANFTRLNVTAYSDYITFIAKVAGVDFIGDTVLVDDTLTPVGSVVTATENRVAVKRIDTITLTDGPGTATILCDDKDYDAELFSDPIDVNSASWSSRGGSEEQNLMEFMVDEQALMRNKGRHFLQANIMETSGNPTNFCPIYNVQDPINVTGSDYKVFAVSRALFNVREREWTADLIEIGTKAAPA